MADDKRVMCKAQVQVFKDTLDNYCNGDLQKALAIIKLATVHQYVDCQWAINLYERGNAPKPFTSTAVTNATLRVTTQKKTTAIGEESF